MSLLKWQGLESNAFISTGSTTVGPPSPPLYVSVEFTPQQREADVKGAGAHAEARQ
jgi:hypothetical protein